MPRTNKDEYNLYMKNYRRDKQTQRITKAYYAAVIHEFKQMAILPTHIYLFRNSMRELERVFNCPNQSRNKTELITLSYDKFIWRQYMEEGKVYKCSDNLWVYVYDYDIRFCTGVDENDPSPRSYFMNINTFPKNPFEVLKNFNHAKCNPTALLFAPNWVSCKPWPNKW